MMKKIKKIDPWLILFFKTLLTSTHGLESDSRFSCRWSTFFGVLRSEKKFDLRKSEQSIFRIYPFRYAFERVLFR